MPDTTPDDSLKRSGQHADGWQHDLQPLTAFDVKAADSASKMLEQMSHTAFGGRNLGEAADVLHEMVADEKCLVVGTFSGAMTIAKMGLLITEMIEQGMLDVVVSTGALMCHGLIEQTGMTHFRYDPSWDDEKLYQAGYARVYDTLELESNLDDAQAIMAQVLAEISPDEPFGSFELNRRIGQHVAANFPGRGILPAAAAKGVPVYVPAFTDSELGIDVFLNNLLAKRAGKRPLRFEPLRDMGDYLERIERAERIGIFTIGGGVPRNWAQQVGPLTEIIHRHTDGELGGMSRFRYAVRICPEPVHWGGLSGCTYSEGVSWGKFVPPEEGGRFAEVPCDATIAWPLLVRGVLERMGRV
jgi:deoxyhypusine synthase